MYILFVLQLPHFLRSLSLRRYNNVGQLSCAICSVLIKSDILWKTHLTSKKHKSVSNLISVCILVVCFVFGKP